MSRDAIAILGPTGFDSLFVSTEISNGVEEVSPGCLHRKWRMAGARGSS